LEGFGSFHISVQSEGTDTAEQLSVHNVKNAHIVFVPSTTLKEGIEHLSYEILTDHAVQSDAAVPPEHTDPSVSEAPPVSE
jgi:hypothetical protein